MYLFGKDGWSVIRRHLVVHYATAAAKRFACPSPELDENMDRQVKWKTEKARESQVDSWNK